MMTGRVLVFGLVVVAACSGVEGPSVEPPAQPTGDNLPTFEIALVEDWYLIGNSLTPGQDELLIQVTTPAGVGTVDMWIGDRPGIRLQEQDGSFVQLADISALGAGEHQILLAADGSDVAFAQVTFRRSHPLYTVVSTDWDDPDNSAEALTLQQDLHDEHPELKLTHFVGPYTFTDPALTEQRRQELAQWVIGMRDTYGDEIGLHIHPYCNFVEDAGIECRHQPSTVYANGDVTGYTVMCAAYTEQEFTTLLEHADGIFMDNGLGKPTSFRAGGWTADLNVMRALGNAGYVADTSANNWQRMEEWKGEQNGVLYDWNAENWASITDTSQPYYPADDDILASYAPYVPVLEVPDNGILVDYVTSYEMIDVFEANWDGGALSAPIAYSIGYHPSNFNSTYKKRMTLAMDHLDRFLASQHNGPVVYETLSNMSKVWPRPE